MGYRMSNRNFEIMLHESGWKPEDGPVPGVWEKNQAGNRCLWSVIWWASDGKINPQDIAPTDPESELWELKDLAGRGNGVAVHMVLNGAKPDEIHSFLAQARERYPEFAYPYSPLFSGTHMIRVREGFPAIQKRGVVHLTP